MKAKILGKLKGIIASAQEASRNGRTYSEHFWDEIFSSDLFQEGIKNKVYFGELWHPDNDAEYGQIHPGDGSAIVLTKVEKKGLDYLGEFDILPTRAGEVLKNLIDVGCVFGVSSRGYNDFETNTFDDPSAFELITFDIVAFPGIKSARLHPVSAIAESFMYKKNRKVKAMENLNRIPERHDKFSRYIDKCMKNAESFVEDNTDDVIVIRFNNKNVAKYNGKNVVVPHYIDHNAGDEYIVDAIFYNEDLDVYKTTGDWLKIN